MTDLRMRMVNSDIPKENTDLIMWLQDYANHGLSYLIDFVHGKARKMPEILQVRIGFYTFIIDGNHIRFCRLSSSKSLINFYC